MDESIYRRWAPTHSQLIDWNTAWEQDHQAWGMKQARDARLAQQNERLAQRLEGQGVTTRRQDQAITAVGLVTGQEDTLEAWRHIQFLPLVAQRDRIPLMQDLRYFIENHPTPEYLRYLVLTSGRRIPVGGPLQRRLKAFNRQISRWASEVRDRYDVEVLYRGVEMTFDDEDGSAHLHANVLVHPRRRLGDYWAVADRRHGWDRDSFLAFTKKTVGHKGEDEVYTWHRDAGRVGEPEEMVKYITKPDDVEALDDDGLLWLFQELYAQRINEPMGSFRAFRAQLEAEGCKVGSVREWDPESGRYRSALRIVQKFQKSRDDQPDPEADGPGENMLLAVTAPQRRFSPWAEPVAIISNWTLNPRSQSGQQRWEKLQEDRMAVKAVWDANGGPTIDEALHTAREILSTVADVASEEPAPDGDPLYSPHVHANCRSGVETGAEVPDRIRPPEARNGPPEEAHRAQRNELQQA